MKVRKRQWITVLALGLTIVFLVACGAKETPPSAPPPTKALAATEEAAAPTTAPAATEAPTATEEAEAKAPAAPSGDTKNVIAKSAADLKNLKSYRVKIIMEQEGGQTMETLVECVMPDKYHMVSDFGDMIIIGDDLYMKAGDDWTKVPGGGAGTEMAEVGVTEEDILEAQLEGSEDVDGVPCHKYVYTTEVEGKTVEVMCWIGVEDGLPHKIVTKMESGMTMTQIPYDFNADITIEPPPGVE
jgi:outer membrane lipoprotein-sorting protein